MAREEAYKQVALELCATLAELHRAWDDRLTKALEYLTEGNSTAARREFRIVQESVRASSLNLEQAEL